jgi:hypothetical protein
MTKLLDQAVEMARSLTAERQDEIARMMLHYADLPAIQLTPEEELISPRLMMRSRGVILPQTNRCVPFGRSMSGEAGKRQILRFIRCVLSLGRHCKRSEAIQYGILTTAWIASSLCSSQ